MPSWLLPKRYKRLTFLYYYINFEISGNGKRFCIKKALNLKSFIVFTNYLFLAPVIVYQPILAQFFFQKNNLHISPEPFFVL